MSLFSSNTGTVAFWETFMLFVVNTDFEREPGEFSHVIPLLIFFYPIYIDSVDYFYSNFISVCMLNTF